MWIICSAPRSPKVSLPSPVIHFHMRLATLDAISIHLVEDNILLVKERRDACHGKNVYSEFSFISLEMLRSKGWF